MTVVQQTTQVGSALAAGPFGSLAVTQPAGLDPGGAALAQTGAAAALSVGGGTTALVTGFNGTGLAAVASAVGTYLGGLSAAKKAQMGHSVIHITPSGFSVPVHNGDVASFGATLTTVLNSAGNYGPIGS